MIEPVPYLTPEQYLEFERAAELRHEYVGGYVYLLAGAWRDHNRIAHALSRLLGNHLDGHPCEVYGSDMKLCVGEAFYYPDVMVCCDATDDHREFVTRPRYVFEVGSPTTRRIDYGEKAAAYYRIESVETYVMVEQEAMRVFVMHRGPRDWEPEILTGADDVLRLDGIGFALPLSAIYARTGINGPGEAA